MRTSHVLNAGAVLIALGCIVLAVSFGSPSRSNAGSAGEISGFMWSDTVGWISTNCADLGTCGTNNYKLSVNAGGEITGYAWSEHIGWVSAQNTDVSTCPTAPCTPRIQDGQLTGWLKALSASGGWDGWIRLSGVSVSAAGVFSGYAWGSDVVGWVDMSLVTTTYRETCAVTTACIAGNLYDQHTNCTQTLIRACTNGCANTITCNPECAPLYACSENSVTYTDAACSISTVATCTAPSFCSPGTPSCVNPPPVITENLEARPGIVQKGGTTKVYWDVENAESCTVTGTNGDSWTASSSGVNGQSSGVIESTTIYTLSCVALEGAEPETITDTVTVVNTPIFQER